MKVQKGIEVWEIEGIAERKESTRKWSENKEKIIGEKIDRKAKNF